MLVKDTEENRNENWTNSRMKCKDGSSTSSSSSEVKKKTKKALKGEGIGVDDFLNLP